MYGDDDNTTTIPNWPDLVKTKHIEEVAAQNTKNGDNSEIWIKQVGKEGKNRQRIRDGTKAPHFHLLKVCQTKRCRTRKWVVYKFLEGVQGFDEAATNQREALKEHFVVLDYRLGRRACRAGSNFIKEPEGKSCFVQVAKGGNTEMQS